MSLAGVASVYGQYLALSEFGGELAGKLLLLPSLDPGLAEVVLAASIAGAASLVIESDPGRIREANRRSVIEFTVNTLDEAIRILKNEIRKRQPVAVCLSAERTACLAEMLARGVEPDLIALSSEPNADRWPEPFVRRGAKVFRRFDSQFNPAGGLLDVTWKVKEAPGIWLPKVDALLEELLSGDLRGRWIRAAPFYLGHALQLERFVRLSREEADAFVASLTRRIRSAEIGVSVTLQVGVESEPVVLCG